MVDGGFPWGRGESSCVNSPRDLFSGKENNGGILDVKFHSIIKIALILEEKKKKNEERRIVRHRSVNRSW